MRTSLGLLLGTVMLAPLAGPAAAQDINSTGTWNGVEYIWPLGQSGTNTYGQTFTVGGESILDSFSFWLADHDGGANTVFQAYVMGWDGTKAAGSVLFESAGFAGTGSVAMQRFDFFTGGLALASGAQYVAFLEAPPTGVHFGSERMGFMDRDVYAGGKFVYTMGSSSWTTAAWATYGQAGSDAAFTANFSAAPVSSTVTPEPVSMALLGTGLAGVGALRRRRRKAAVAETD